MLAIGTIVVDENRGQTGRFPFSWQENGETTGLAPIFIRPDFRFP
jgi:hypothetical protein